MKSLVSQGKDLKHINIQGVMSSCGEYSTNDLDIRPYEAVTIRDNGGEEIHFRLLLVPKRLDDAFNVGDEASFYILRHKTKDGQFAGAMYAIEVDGKKHYYPDSAWKAVKSIALLTSRRWAILRAPATFAVMVPLSCFIVGGLVALVLSNIVGRQFGVFLGICAAIYWVYMLLFPLIRTRQYVNSSEMEEVMQSNNFKLPALGAASNKY